MTCDADSVLAMCAEPAQRQVLHPISARATAVAGKLVASISMGAAPGYERHTPHPPENIHDVSFAPLNLSFLI